jgi:hypothetical protein
MKREIFNNLQKHVFDKGNPWDIWADKSRTRPNRLPYFSTWFIWNHADLEDVTLINPGNADRLNPGMVFVALNFSGALRPDWPDWQNIHGVGRMYKLLRGTRYEGAYSTDFIKNYPGSTSGIVRNEIENNEKRRNKNIDCFFEEMELLGADPMAGTIEMYLVGGDVAALFRNHVMKHPGFNKFRQKVKKCIRMDHYSGRNPHFESNAPTQLGLASNPKASIHPPLWDDLKQNTGKKPPSSILIKKGGKP